MAIFPEGSYKSLIDRIIADDLAGWDPYDGINTGNRVIICCKHTRLLSTYFNKFSPINFRPLLGVRRSRQLQAMAFVGLALLECDSGDHRNTLDRIIREAKAQTLKERTGNHTWESHGFPMHMTAGYRPPGTPDVVGNEAIARLLWGYGNQDNDEESKTMAVDFRDYVMSVLLVQNGDAAFVRYKPTTPRNRCCYNASLLGAAFVAEIDRHASQDPDPVIDACLRFVCKHQKPEGYWNYSLNLETGEEKPQVDFHQGFILDCLLRYMELYGFEESFLSAYERGLAFYRNEQFFPNGQSLYRWPRKWPVNIHNQAQGILTFARASVLDPKHLDFANTIAEWTIRHMQGPDGHFYYLKYPFFTNKIPYIRWNDAAMAYALAVLLQVNEGRASKVSGTTSESAGKEKGVPLAN